MRRHLELCTSSKIWHQRIRVLLALVQPNKMALTRRCRRCRSHGFQGTKSDEGRETILNENMNEKLEPPLTLDTLPAPFPSS